MSHEIVLAGPFDPATVAGFAPTNVRAVIEGMRSAPGVPIHTLAEAMVNLGQPVRLIGGVRDQEPVEINGIPLSVSIYRSSGGWPFVLNGRAAERRAILQILERIRPAIVHAHWTFEAGRAVADWRGAKVLTVHDTAWEYARLGFSWRPLSMAYTVRWLEMTMATLRRFQHLIAVSPYVEQYLRRQGFKGEIRMIPNALPPLPFEIPNDQPFPKSGRLTFGCYGEPGGLKNTDSAVRAFAIVRKREPDARMLVYGRGWGEYRKQRDVAGLEFRGAKPHIEFLRDLANEVDIWVHPSRVETHGLSICEAIQAGCPSIGGRNSGAVAWTLDMGRVGMLVDVGKPAEIAEAMLQLAWDPSHAKTLVRDGRAMIEQRFDAKKILEQHLSYYREI